MNLNVIVTGGAGFIGSNIVSALLDKGFNVHVFDNLSTGNINNLNLEKIKFYKIDLNSNFKNWPKIRASKIYHLAANADVRGGISDHNIDLNVSDDFEITSMLVKFKSPVGLIQLPRKVNETTSFQAAIPVFEINRLTNLLGFGVQTINVIALIIILVSGLTLLFS